jgi:hypothetical protein
MFLIFRAADRAVAGPRETGYGPRASHTDNAQLLAVGGTDTMETLLVFHEVDDVDHWLSSPKREELFGPLGMTARTFRDPAGSNRVGLIVEVPDVAAWEEALKTDAAAEAMKSDGVRPDTILGLVEA